MSYNTTCCAICAMVFSSCTPLRYRGPSAGVAQEQDNNLEHLVAVVYTSCPGFDKCLKVRTNHYIFNPKYVSTRSGLGLRVGVSVEPSNLSGFVGAGPSRKLGYMIRHLPRGDHVSRFAVSFFFIYLSVRLSCCCSFLLRPTEFDVYSYCYLSLR